MFDVDLSGVFDELLEQMTGNDARVADKKPVPNYVPVQGQGRDYVAKQAEKKK